MKQKYVWLYTALVYIFINLQLFLDCSWITIQSTTCQFTIQGKIFAYIFGYVFILPAAFLYYSFFDWLLNYKPILKENNNVATVIATVITTAFALICICFLLQLFGPFFDKNVVCESAKLTLYGNCFFILIMFILIWSIFIGTYNMVYSIYNILQKSAIDE